MRKIDIYYKGSYICSTTQRKTCKEAKEKFVNNPTYASVPYNVYLVNVNPNDIVCRFNM